MPTLLPCYNYPNEQVPQYRAVYGENVTKDDEEPITVYHSNNDEIVGYTRYTSVTKNRPTKPPTKNSNYVELVLLKEKASFPKSSCLRRVSGSRTLPVTKEARYANPFLICKCEATGASFQILTKGKGAFRI